MKQIRLHSIGALTLFAAATHTYSATIAGTDFSDSAVFNAAGGAFANGTMDDLDLADGVTVSGWSFANGGGFVGLDANAQVGMPNDNVTKFNGASPSAQPGLGDSGASLATHTFSITIPSDRVVNLTSITFDWRMATGDAANSRWLAFDTSLDAGVIFSEVGLVRNAFDSETVDLSGGLYQGLTNTTVSFNFYAGGTGSGDIDIDTIVLNGNVIPEPSTGLLGLFGFAFLVRRRR